MVDLTFKSRAKHLVPLALLKQIAEFPPDQVPEDISYLGTDGCKAIKGTSFSIKNFQPHVMEHRNGPRHQRAAQRAARQRGGVDGN